MKRHRIIEFLIHFVCALILFVALCFFTEREAGVIEINWHLFRRHGVILLLFAFIFYINYFWLIPKVYFKKKKWRYIFVNVLMVIGIAAIGQVSQYYERLDAIVERQAPLCSEISQPQTTATIPDFEDPEFLHLYKKSVLPHHLVFFLRDVLLLALAVALSLALRLILQVREIEAQKNEYERAKFEAELANMRSQVNPHFLLNTLNNIYSLIQFDSEKAQTAVLELSKLLRYVLYEDKTELVSLQTVIDFLKHYIYLMKIRLTDGVTVDVDMSCDFDTLVPPLLSVSLVENAFKHGVSPEGEGELSFYLHDEEDGRVVMRVKNTNYPKTKQDRSGSGIGLKLLKRRLDMMYPGKYEFSSYVTEDNKYYISNLIINTDNHDN